MLAEKGGNYFPYVIFMDSDGKVLFELHPWSEEPTRQACADVRMLLDSRAALAKKPDDALARARLEIIQAAHGMSSAGGAPLERLLATPGLSKELRARGEKAVVQQVLDDYKREYGKAEDPAARDAAHDRAARRAYECYLHGWEYGQEGDPGYVSAAWLLTFSGAIAAKDRETAARALKAYEERFKDEKGFAKRIPKLRAQLAKLPAGAGAPSAKGKHER